MCMCSMCNGISIWYCILNEFINRVRSSTYLYVSCRAFNYFSLFWRIVEYGGLEETKRQETK